MSSNWSRNLRDGGDQKAIRQSYDGNIILTRYKWFIGGVYLDRGADIDSLVFEHLSSGRAYRRGRRTFPRSFRDLDRALSEIVSRAMKNAFNGWEIKHPDGIDESSTIRRRDKASKRVL